MKLLNQLKKLNQLEFLNKRQMHFAYCFGASIVIVGAWMKITHVSFMGITGNASAFEKPEPTYDWTIVYPELKKKKKEERKLYDIKVNEDELKALNRLKK